MVGRLPLLTRQQVPIERDDIAEFYVGLHPSVAWLVVHYRIVGGGYNPLEEELNWYPALRKQYGEDPSGNHLMVEIGRWLELCHQIEKCVRGLREQDILLRF